MEQLTALREKLAGKKTYFVSASGLIAAVIAWIGGTMSDAEFIQTIIVALLGSTLKAGQARQEVKTQ